MASVGTAETVVAKPGVAVLTGDGELAPDIWPAVGGAQPKPTPAATSTERQMAGRDTAGDPTRDDAARGSPPAQVEYEACRKLRCDTARVMNDPHVVALHYRMCVRDSVIFESPPPLLHEAGPFTLHLDGGRLRVTMQEHFSAEQLARETVDPFLDTWVLHAALRAHRRDFWFEYEHAEVIDRAPPPEPPGVVVAGTALMARFEVHATGTVSTTRRAYPTPPESFCRTSLVEALFHLYQSSVNERRFAAAAGYFALTAIKTRVREPGWPGGVERSKLAADALGVEHAIFQTLHDLTTEKGDITTGRKVSDKAELERPRPPHTGPELLWLCEAIRVLALRLGEWEADPNGLSPLTMAHLPSLT